MKQYLFILFFTCSISLSHAQPGNWSKKIKGVQFGVEIEAGRFSSLCHVYAKYTGRKKMTWINYFPKISFIAKQGSDKYALTPSAAEYIPKRMPRPSQWAGPKLEIPMILKRGQEVLLGTYVVQHVSPESDEYCYKGREYYDSLHVVVTNVFPDTNLNDKVFKTKVQKIIPCCGLSTQIKQEETTRIRFFKKLVEHSDTAIFDLAVDILRDTLLDDGLRSTAGAYFRDLNTESGRDVLYSMCKNRDDKLLDNMLLYLFHTKDPRAVEFFEMYYDHPLNAVRLQLIIGIGMVYRSEEHLDLLIRLTNDSVSRVRELVAENLQYFDHPEARETLHLMLKDSDASVKYQVLRSLRKVGNEGSLEYLIEYIERVPSVDEWKARDALTTAEAISGKNFNGNVEKLRKYVASLKK